MAHLKKKSARAKAFALAVGHRGKPTIRGLFCWVQYSEHF